MHIITTSFNGNPAIGLYAVATDTCVLVGKEVPDSFDEELKKVTNLPIRRITIAGTSLIGVFCFWHKDKLFVPSIVFDHELEALEGLNVVQVNSELTCLGNNILASDNALLVNPEFTDEDVTELSEKTGLPCLKGSIMEIEAIGSIGVIRGDKGLFHRDISDDQVVELEELLGIKISLGSVNMGNPYIKSGVILGKDWLIVGNASGGPEITHIDESLGFLDEE